MDPVAFFRAKTLGQALAYFKSLFLLGGAEAASDVPAGAMYTRLHAGVFVLAAVLVWAAPNTWTFTSRLTTPRVVGALGLLALAVFAMWTQSANPFLYFQF